MVYSIGILSIDEVSSYNAFIQTGYLSLKSALNRIYHSKSYEIAAIVLSIYIQGVMNIESIYIYYIKLERFELKI